MSLVNSDAHDVRHRGRFQLRLLGHRLLCLVAICCAAGIPWTSALADTPRHSTLSDTRTRRVLTIKKWLEGLGRQHLPTLECPVWPPDLYAVAGALLKRSGAYLRVFEHDGVGDYLGDIEHIGESWLKNLDALPQPVTVPGLRAARPREIQKAWSEMLKFLDIPISQIRQSRPLAEHLIRMALIADEASAGVGVDGERTDHQDGKDKKTSKPSTLLSLAGWMLRSQQDRSFCWEVPADAICVLGKQHTPQRGATFRSLSHHLSLYFPNDIEARWVGPLQRPVRNQDRRETLNLLLLPWPTHIETDDFQNAP